MWVSILLDTAIGGSGGVPALPEVGPFVESSSSSTGESKRENLKVFVSSEITSMTSPYDRALMLPDHRHGRAKARARNTSCWSRPQTLDDVTEVMRFFIFLRHVFSTSALAFYCCLPSLQKFENNRSRLQLKLNWK